MHLAVVAAVFTVNIVKDVRVDHRVIQSRVKIGRLLVRSARNLDLTELFIPLFFSFSPHLVKIPMRQFDSSRYTEDPFQVFYPASSDQTRYVLFRKPEKYNDEILLS